MTEFQIAYTDNAGTPQTLDLRKPYYNSIEGKLDFNYTNLSFRSGNYSSYVDSISDEGITLNGFEDTDALNRLLELSAIADSGYEITITGLGDAYNGVYVIESFSYKPISLDVFEYNMTLKFVSE